MKTGLCIVARVESTRLPRKHFIDVEGKCFIEWLLLRMTHHFESQIKKDNIKIIIATADTKPNREFLQLKEKYPHLEIYFGSEKNIPQRLWQCAEHYNLDYVVNIDGDDVLCSPLAVEKTIAAQNKNSDYIFTSGLPLGMNCISISKKVLGNFFEGIKDSTIMETGWGRMFDGVNKREIVIDGEANTELRFTLDYEDDATFFKNIITHFGENIIDADDRKIINYVVENKVYEINSHLNTMYFENFSNQIKKENEL